MTELHNDHAQIANNEGAYIPMEDVDAALRRIEHMVFCLPTRDERERLGQADIKRIIAGERERLGLPKGVKA